MLKSIKESVINMVTSRVFVLIIVFTCLSGILIYRLFSLQIVHGEEYLDGFKLKIRKERTIASTRGNIYDRNGELMAYNELAYSVTIEDVYESGRTKNEQLNGTISRLIDMIEENNDKIINDFDIVLDENNQYAFTVEGKTLLRFLADIYGKPKTEDLEYAERTATAEEVISYLAGTKKFAIGEYLDPNDRNSDFIVGSGYTKEKLLQMVTIRYAMSLNSYQKYIATTVAKDVSDETVAMIMENADVLDGVSVTEDTIRKYVDSVYYSHIIGYIGKISDDEYAQLSEEDEKYSLTDIVGKSGIEQYMETTLQGTKGTETVYVDNMGKVIETSDRKEPAAGNNVYLTIDMKLQKAVYNLLEQKIAGILVSKIRNIKEFTLGENESASKLQIPIYDVYFALFNNGVIDTGNFQKDTAKDTEKTVYQTFLNKQASVVDTLHTELATNATTYNNLSLEYQVYELAIVSMLEDNGVIMTDEIDKEDSTYLAWKKDEVISLQEYLTYLISKGWIDITKLSLESQYSDSEEIYARLIDYIDENLIKDSYFNKRLYKYMLLDDQITGAQVCMLLFEQNIIDGTDEEKQAVQSGSKSAYSFMLEKIENLDITPAQLALDPCSGSCVITDVKTGELLALVSYPGYDNNRLANTVDADYFASLNTDLSKPLYNYATQERTAPGSTFKMVSSVAGLATGVITPTTQIMDKGVYENISNHPRCWALNHGYTHGLINVSEALRDSCNYFFYDVGYRLATNNFSTSYDDATGISKIQEYASLLGLDETTGVEIEENDPQIADEYPVMAAIGQSNNNYATIQLGRYVSAIANDGNVYEYTLLSKVCDSDGNTLETFEPKVRNTVDVLDTTQWNAIHTGMRMVVENLSTFDDFPIDVAGKTGTAQQSPNRPNHALFVGYAPYSDPEISIATRIAFGYTSHNAAEYAKNVFSYYFDVQDAEELLNGQAENVGESSNSFND